MATIGLSKPFYAIYANNGSAVSYSNGGVLGKFTDLNIELDDADANILYGDNAPAESDTQFIGGTVDVSTTELLPTIAKIVLGLKSESVGAVTGLETQNATWNVFDDDQNAPYLGLGGIIKKKVDGAYKWVAFVLNKIQFKTPGETATTQGETVEWQVPTLSGTIMRSDAEKHAWYRQSSLLDTEADAELLIRSYLNITDTPPETSGEPVAAAAGAGKVASK